MAVRRNTNKDFKKLKWKSGHIYTFDYHAYHNDPKPTIILMYALEGTRTWRRGKKVFKHEYRFFQGINFSYIPRSMRRTFIKKWMRTYERTGGNIKFTYESMKRSYPWMILAIRRYFFKPSYYIKNPRKINFEDWQNVVTETMTKDFSKVSKESAKRVLALRKRARQLRTQRRKGRR